jgi:hypothetical protein
MLFARNVRSRRLSGVRLVVSDKCLGLVEAVRREQFMKPSLTCGSPKIGALNLTDATKRANAILVSKSNEARHFDRMICKRIQIGIT